MILMFLVQFVLQKWEIVLFLVPDGKIYKCLSMVGRIEGIIGDWKMIVAYLHLKIFLN